MQVIRNPGSLDAFVRRPSSSPASASSASASDDTRRIVEEILADVKDRGDAAVRELTERFDGVRPESLEIERGAWRTGASDLGDELRSAMLVAMRNIEAFHRAQAVPERMVETSRGVFCRRRSVPIERVGLYVPGGTAPLFSTVLMLAVPARIAGCREIVICTPPGKDGKVNPAILYAAAEAGVSRVFGIGGAQAIAAMAYGTESIPQVDKIFGPGNRFVDMAKQLVSAEGVAIDLPAGPTEVAVVMDASSDPSFVAADVLAQAEHDPLAGLLVVAIGDEGVFELGVAVEEQMKTLPRAAVAGSALENGRIVVVDSADEAVALVDAWAPEHLIIQTRDAEMLAERVSNAGSIFIGPWTPESLGDYASGPNHTLPTAGAARAWSGVSLGSFVRKITVQSATRDGLAGLGPTAVVMARAEGLEGHARSVELRLAATAEPGSTSRQAATAEPGSALRQAATAEPDSPPRQAATAEPAAASPAPPIPQPPLRTGFVRRTTAETDVLVHVDLDGAGRSDARTGLGFLDHMLDQIARHSGIDLSVRCDGDLQVDEHHSIEDTAITLGQAMARALGAKRGIRRFGFTAPMDDALATVALDLSGRAFLVWEVSVSRERVGDVPTEMFEHFFRSFCDAAACNLNVRASGENDHHVIESVFKAFARALGEAVRFGNDPQALPSTKGSL